jgi:5'-hydroxyaverantin dehydrogenase
MAALDLAALKGRSVLVTGGGSGIGLASAQAFASAGAYVTIADIQPIDTIGAEIVKQATSSSQHVNYTHCDVTDWQSQIAAFRSAIKFAPNQTLDVVLICAGIASQHGSLLDHLADTTPTLEDEPPMPAMKCMDVNLTGAFYSTQLALNYMRLPGTDSSLGDSTKPPPSKSLIFVDSMAGFFDFPQHTAYNVSKTGTRALFRSIRSTTSTINVRCNLIAPWFVKTALTSSLQAKLPGGKGISWTEIEDVVSAIGACAVDEGINGELSSTSWIME